MEQWVSGKGVAVDRWQRVERSAMGILLLVGLVTFFFPLVTFQVPVLGDQSLTGYDILSKITRQFNERLSSTTKGSTEAGSEPGKRRPSCSMAAGSEPPIAALSAISPLSFL